MDNFKEASRQQLRFQTTRGLLTTEQLWDLSVTDLDKVAVILDDEYKLSGKKSFLVAKSSKDKTLKLKFDIVLDILTTKVEEAEEAKVKAENKAHNEKIINLISEKQDEALKGKSVTQLKAMLK
jgi:hypothetical protein